MTRKLKLISDTFAATAIRHLDDRQRCEFLQLTATWWLSFRLALVQVFVYLLILLYPAMAHAGKVPMVNDGLFAFASIASLGAGELMREMLIEYVRLQRETVALERVVAWEAPEPLVDLEREYPSFLAPLKKAEQTRGREVHNPRGVVLRLEDCVVQYRVGNGPGGASGSGEESEVPGEESGGGTRGGGGTEAGSVVGGGSSSAVGGRGLQEVGAGSSMYRIALAIETLEIFRGEHVLIVGRTGSGKSTLFLSLLQMVPLLRGSIKFYDRGDREFFLNRAVTVARRSDHPPDEDLRFVTSSSSDGEEAPPPRVAAAGRSSIEMVNMSGRDVRSFVGEPPARPSSRASSLTEFQPLPGHESSSSASHATFSEHDSLPPHAAEDRLPPWRRLLPTHLVRTRVLRAVPQTPVVLRGTVLQNLDLDDANLDRIRAREALSHFFDDEDLDVILDAPVATLSFAHLQLLQASRVVLSGLDFDILLLDEVTAALSEAQAGSVLRRIMRCFRGKTVLCIAHQQMPADLFDRVVSLRGGRVAGESAGGGGGGSVRRRRGQG